MTSYFTFILTFHTSLVLSCNSDVSKTVLDTVGAVVGTGKGVVIEYFGGENNGQSCPPANLDLQEDWMGELADQEIKLRKLVLPGVHHHGIIESLTSYVGVLPGSKVLDWSVCQSLSVTDQLRTGARFLDVRLTKHEGIIYTAHGTRDKLTVRGVTFLDLLTENINFLKDHPGEVLVWTFLWEFGPSHWPEVEATLEKYKDQYFYTAAQDPLEVSLSQLGGKIVICREGENNLQQYRTLNCRGSWQQTHSKDPPTLVNNILDYMTRPSEMFNYLEVVATIDAEGILASLNIFSPNPDNLKDLACQVNKEAEKIFTEENTKYLDNFNAIMLDYPHYYDVIQKILAFNKIKIET